MYGKNLAYLGGCYLSVQADVAQNQSLDLVDLNIVVAEKWEILVLCIITECHVRLFAFINIVNICSSFSNLRTEKAVWHGKMFAHVSELFHLFCQSMKPY